MCNWLNWRHFSTNGRVDCCTGRFQEEKPFHGLHVLLTSQRVITLFGGYLKSKAYLTKPRDIDELEKAK
jgi:hypothetical protein